MDEEANPKAIEAANDRPAAVVSPVVTLVTTVGSVKNFDDPKPISEVYQPDRVCREESHIRVASIWKLKAPPVGAIALAPVVPMALLSVVTP